MWHSAKNDFNIFKEKTNLRCLKDTSHHSIQISTFQNYNFITSNRHNNMVAKTTRRHLYKTHGSFVYNSFRYDVINPRPNRYVYVIYARLIGFSHFLLWFCTCQCRMNANPIFLILMSNCTKCVCLWLIDWLKSYLEIRCSFYKNLVYNIVWLKI